MTPVISPWIFYIMSVSDGLLNSVGWLFVGSLVALLGLGLYYFNLASDSEIERTVLGVESKTYLGTKTKMEVTRKRVKPLVIFTIVMCLMRAFIPSTDTITKMIIAQNVTYERVEVVGDTVETVYNDIMALFEDNNSEGEAE